MQERKTGKRRRLKSGLLTDFQPERKKKGCTEAATRVHQKRGDDFEEVNQVKKVEERDVPGGVCADPAKAHQAVNRTTGIEESTSEEGITSPVEDGSKNASGCGRKRLAKTKKRGRGLI